MKRKYQILEALPTNGPMYIPITENGDVFYSEGFVLKFIKDSEEEWIANIRPGMSDFFSVFEIDNINLLVIAGGTVYIINPNIEKPIMSFGGGVDFCNKIEKDRFLLCDGICLTILEKNLEYWNSERISWDGIKNIKINGSIVSGESYTPMNSEKEWIDFQYDIDKKELIGGSFRDSYIKKKPWWKFW